MPDTNDRVMAMIEKELQANPDISNEDLRVKAEKLDDSVARMSARQFNARYPLQVKWRMRPRRRAGRKRAGTKGARGGAATSGRKRGRPAKGSADTRSAGRVDSSARDRVRSVLVGFASDLASADGAGLVRVIAGVDGYVDKVMKAAGR